MKRIAIALACAAAIGTAAAQSGIQNPITQAVLQVYAEELEENPNDYSVLMSRADEYYRHDEYIRALDDVNRVLELVPATDEDIKVRALVLRAGIYNETKRHEDALADLTAADAISPDSYYIIYQKANTEYMLEQYPQARGDFQRLVRVNSRAPEAYIGLARVAVKENNLGTANEMLESAVNLDPNNAETYVRRASVRRLIGDHNGAVDDLILALSTDNKHSRALQELIDYGNTNYAATMAGLSSAISQAPQVGMFRYIRAVIAQAHYHYLAAIQDYRVILDENLYNYNGIYASIAECQYALGNYDEALSNIDYALGSFTDNAGYFVLRSQILRALHRNDEAVQAAASGLAVDRQSCPALAEMALAYVATGNYDDASNLLGEAILNDAENPQYRMLRAWVLEKFLNRAKPAEQLYEIVSEFENFNLDNPRSLKGFALLFLGKTDEADRWMKNILDTAVDNDGLIHYYGACFYAQAGDTDKAMDCARKSLELGYANYHDWTEAADGRVNVAPLRDDLTFLNLLHKYNAIFGK
ncbi:MAG: tetratricopeptide repeat protein [Bacteroidales bacterium]|nr:tetratricopeptide repeat protein [Bacteroidales bacterium]MBD5218638.1 tetratricopeptide repeat protein [Bacteroidales bacterium]